MGCIGGRIIHGNRLEVKAKSSEITGARELDLKLQEKSAQRIRLYAFNELFCARMLTLTSSSQTNKTFFSPYGILVCDGRTTNKNSVSILIVSNQ